MTDAILLGAAFALVAGAGVLYWQDRDRKGASPKPAAPSKQTPTARTLGVRPGPSYLPVMHYDELVSSTDMAGRIAKIEQKLAFAPNNFQADVLPLLQRFCEFVQLLPASESHHHAQPGGLLIHLIEVAEYALHFRDSYKLPIGASTEEQARLGARYSYAVLVAALLHDVGKPVADVRVQIVGADNGEPRAWTALAGSMLEQRAAWYSVAFPRADERDYKAHQRLPVILLQRIVPGSTLAWLGEYAPLLQELMSYLGGEESAKDGMISTIVKRADSFSVADNLKSGSRIRFASATAVPLIERLMRGMRDLLAQGGLSLNRPGAVGFCDGEHLWFVAGTLADAVRQHLDQTEHRLSGAADLPTDNLRFFDTWQEYGALVPNDAGTSIWEVAINIGTWSQKLRVLKFDLKLLYGSLANAPSALPKGTIEPVADKRSTVAATSGKTAQNKTVADIPVPATLATVPDPISVQAAPRSTGGGDTPETLPEPARVFSADNIEHQSPESVSASAINLHDAAPAPAVPIVAESAMDEAYPEFDEDPVTAPVTASKDTAVSSPSSVDLSHAEATSGSRTKSKANAVSISVEQTRPISVSPASERPITSSEADAGPSILDVLMRQAKEKAEFLDDADGAAALQQSEAPLAASPALQPPMRPKQREIKTRAPRKKSRPNAELLLAWIQQGIADGTVLFNESKGFVHFVAEGMVLISPRVFVEFANANRDRIQVPEDKADSDLWRIVQADFQSSSYPLKNGNSFLHRYVVTGPHGSVLNANVVAEPDRFFNPVPQANVLLTRVESPAAAGSKHKLGAV